MGDHGGVADAERPTTPDPYGGPSPYDNETAIDRTMAQLRALPMGHRRQLPDPDNPYRPELHVFERIASMKQASERVERNAIPVPDSDELCSDDVEAFRLGRGRFVPASAYAHRGATGLAVLVERGTPSIVFLRPDQFPVRAKLPSARLLAGRVRAALGDDSRFTTGPPIDDPRWRGIGVALVDDSVHLRLHTEFDRTVALEPVHARGLAGILEDIVGSLSRRPSG
jgi:hypothetical protein